MKVDAAIHKMQKKLMGYWDKVNNSAAYAATALDPRIKRDLFPSSAKDQAEVDAFLQRHLTYNERKRLSMTLETGSSGPANSAF